MARFQMISRSRSLVAAAMIAAAGLSAVVMTPAAYAAPVAPNATLDPVPGGTLPSGTVQEYTTSRGFDFFITVYINSPAGPIPVLRQVTGTLTQRVYRQPDNTIAFGYSLANASDSQNDVSRFSVRDFSEYTTDVTVFSGIAPITSQSPNSAHRSSDGGSVEFTYDSGINIGTTTRTVYVRTNATAYQTPGRFVPVSSRATVCAGNGCQNLYGFAYPVEDSTPPVVSITAPAQLSCVCNPATITGTAYDPNGFDSYELEYSANPNGPWTLIHTGNSPVSPAGSLASWNTTSVSQGYYFLRLTGFNTTGLSSSVTSIVFVDKQFDTVDVRGPQTGQILGGGVCFDGTVADGNSGACFQNYRVDFAPLPAGAPFNPVNPATPTYSTPVTNDGLGSWITTSGGAAVADGSYRVRVMGTDDCGHTRTVTRDLIIDNTRPVAAITSPGACSIVGGVVAISGTASDANMAGWTLQYTGGDSSGWVTIASGNSNAAGVLANWNTAGLRPCSYTLRLIAGDAASINCGSTNNQTEFLVSVRVGCPADYNSSGGVTVQDIFDFLAAYFAGCP
jgi:hypothetical protein